MKFLVPQGIGDSIWALHKVQDIARKNNDKTIEVFLNYTHINEAECRAYDFIKRFNFVDNCEMLQMGIMIDPVIDSEGKYTYIPDGWCGEYFVLMPNGPLERGVNLQDWLPEYETNWNATKDFSFTKEESKLADDLKTEAGDYALFFMGSMGSNTTDGHNRGCIWKPKDWLDLGHWLHETYGLSIVVVGATYDKTFYDALIDPHVKDLKWWHNRVGKHAIWETFSICSRARMALSYQAGIGIFTHYMGVPLGIFWRAKGDSILSGRYLSFEESMASGWANPEYVSQGKHLPLIYGRHGLEYIKQEIVARKW
jgi:hypothetical protein